MEITFQHVGWKSKVMQKRATLSITINKSVSTGCCLGKGKELYCYLAEDEFNRPVMVTYLDGEEKPLVSRKQINLPIASEKLTKYGKGK